MYFYKDQRKQRLDLTGNLILSHNDQLVKARSASAGPAAVKNAKYVIQCHKLSFKNKIKASCAALSFIWGSSTELKPSDTNLSKPFTNPNDCQCKDDQGNYINDCGDCPR